MDERCQHRFRTFLVEEILAVKPCKESCTGDETAKERRRYREAQEFVESENQKVTTERHSSPNEVDFISETTDQPSYEKALDCCFIGSLRCMGGDQVTTQGSQPTRRRRSRSVFTDVQLAGLECRFARQKYLSSPDRMALAHVLGLTQLQVKTWYQNRRMKWKKAMMELTAAGVHRHSFAETAADKVLTKKQQRQ